MFWFKGIFWVFNFDIIAFKNLSIYAGIIKSVRYHGYNECCLRGKGYLVAVGLKGDFVSTSKLI